MAVITSNLAEVQKLFDQAVGGIIKQGRPSMTPVGVCQYRGPDGLKCVIGMLIPDDKYNRRMEGIELNRLPLISFPPPTTLWTSLQDSHDRRAMKLLAVFRSMHDGAVLSRDDVSRFEKEFVEDFRKDAKHLAEKYCLEWNHSAQRSSEGES